MPTVDAKSGGTLYYQMMGRGRDVVFVLPGTGISGHYLQTFAHALSSKLKVVVPDHRGTGRSTAAVTPGSTIFDIIKDCIAIADAEEISEFFVIGESYGGMLGLALAMNYPSRVRRLACINTTVGGLGRPRLSSQAFLRLLESAVFPARSARALSSFLFSVATQSKRPDVVQEWCKLYQEVGIPQDTATKQLLMAARFYPGEALESISCPCLFVVGEKDSMIDSSNSKMLTKSLSKSKMIVVEGGGHHLAFEHPEEVARIVLSFFIS